jgi:hypothetical protein
MAIYVFTIARKSDRRSGRFGTPLRGGVPRRDGRIAPLKKFIPALNLSPRRPIPKMPYHSPFPPFELPHCDWTQLIFERRETSLPFPRDHIITQDADTGEGLSFHQVQELSRALGRGLKTHFRFGKGDVICLFSTNHVIPLLNWR